MMTAPIFLFLLQSSESPPDNINWPAIVIAVGGLLLNLVQYISNRRKSSSEVSHLDAQTLKTYIDAIKEIQSVNDSLYTRMGSLRAQLEQLEADLEDSREEHRNHLASCVKRDEECEECQMHLRTIAVALKDTTKLMSSLTTAEQSVATIAQQSIAAINKLSEDILARAESGEEVKIQ
jgi:chromosome segregation ATPase